MSRPLRVGFPGAALLTVPAQGMQRFDAQVLACCLMGHHDHFVLHTRQANLSRLMRHINGVYTQVFSRQRESGGAPGP